MNNNSSNKKISTDPFAPFDFDARSRQAEQNDSFNLMVSEVAQHPGGLRSQLLKLAATSDEAQAVLAAEGIELPTVPKQCRLSQGEICTVVADGSGLWTASIVVDGRTVAFQSEDRDSALMACERHMAEARGPHFKTLDEGQLLNIVRLSQNGDWQTAIGTYMYFVLGDQVTDQHPEEIASNPKYLPVMNAAVYFVWRHMNNAYVPSPQAEASLTKFAGDRPLTMALCQAWWLAHQELEERRAAQADAPETERAPAATPEEIQRGLEGLTTDQLERLRLQTLKHRGQLIRRFDERISGGR